MEPGTDERPEAKAAAVCRFPGVESRSDQKMSPGGNAEIHSPR